MEKSLNNILYYRICVGVGTVYPKVPEIIDYTATHKLRRKASPFPQKVLGWGTYLYAAAELQH